MKFKSALVTEVSGSIGGMTGSHNRGGLYFRARTIPTDPASLPQQLLRAQFGSLVQRWIDTLTALQRAAWELYAANVPITGPLGDPITISGMNHYVRANVPRLQLVTTTIDIAPSTFNLGTLSPVTFTALSEATQDFAVNFTDADGWNIANGHMTFQQSRPQNPTINFFRGPYRHAGSVNGIAVSPVTKPVVFPVIQGQRVFFRARATYADGRLTQTQYLGPVTVGA